MGSLKPSDACPCGSGKPYAGCCGPLHAGEITAPTAEALMRSRYAAYVLKLEDYLLATWHTSTRPGELDLVADDSKWLGLEVHAHQQQDETHATVEFVARYRIAGRGYRLHELSRFIKENGIWMYIDGVINP